MSFDMRPLPPEPDRQKNLLFLWAIAYMFLGFGFVILGWVLIFQHRSGLGLLSVMASWVCFGVGNKRTNEFKRYQRLEDE